MIHLLQEHPLWQLAATSAESIEEWFAAVVDYVPSELDVVRAFGQDDLDPVISSAAPQVPLQPQQSRPHVPPPHVPSPSQHIPGDTDIPAPTHPSVPPFTYHPPPAEFSTESRFDMHAETPAWARQMFDQLFTQVHQVQTQMQHDFDQVQTQMQQGFDQVHTQLQQGFSELQERVVHMEDIVSNLQSRATVCNNNRYYFTSFVISFEFLIMFYIFYRTNITWIPCTRPGVTHLHMLFMFPLL